MEEALAYALLKLGDYNEADALFTKLRKASPDKLKLTLKHADLMRRRNKGKDVANGTKLLEGLASPSKSFVPFATSLPLLRRRMRSACFRVSLSLSGEALRNLVKSASASL